MFRPTGRPAGMDAAGSDDDTGVEDSLRGAQRGVPRPRAAAAAPLQRDASGLLDSYAFDTTPDAVPGASLVNPALRLGSPPRIQRPVAATTAVTFGGLAPPPPLHAPGGLFGGLAGQPTLFTRPQASAMGGSEAEESASMSASFTFAPARRAADQLGSLQPWLAGPASRAAPHTPVRAGPTTALAAATALAHTPANLESAALAAERRTREQRHARPAAAEPSRRTVSFSTAPTAATPVNMLPASMHAPAPPARAVGRREAEASWSNLGGRVALPFGAGGGDVSISMSDASVSPALGAVRLFAPMLAATAGAEGASEAEPSYADPSTSASVVEPVDEVRLRRWDGTHVSVPSYVVSDRGDADVEKQFDYDAIARFDIGAVVSAQADAVAGRAARERSKERGEGDDGVDALQGVLEVQLGLRGMHGWYGHSYPNPRPPCSGRTSRKRRRRDSIEHDEQSYTEHDDDDDDEAEEGQIVVYDTFGRVRGSVTLPSYRHRGGPSLPLPSPAQTHAMRRSAATHLTLTTHTALANREAKLIAHHHALRHQYASLHTDSPTTTLRSPAFYTELRTRSAALSTFRNRVRGGLKTALQNAYLDTALHVPRRGV